MAAGVATAVLGLALAVGQWPDPGSAATTQLAATADGHGPDDASVAAEARRATAVLAQERASRRGRTASPPETPTARVVAGRAWAKARVNIRSGPSIEAARVGGVEAAQQVRTTGVTDDDWTQIVSDGRTGWVKSSYVSTTRPAPTPKAASAPSGVSSAPCSISPSIESGLTANARSVYRAVCAAHGGSVSSFAGFRSGDDGDHGSGRAVDIMVSGDPGWAIARYVQAHARALHVTYVIYQQKIWMAGNPTSQWKLMEDRGGITANHFDHVHVSVA